MKILGNRILVSRVEEEKKEGEFNTVDVQDSFVNKGKLEDSGPVKLTSQVEMDWWIEHVHLGSIVLFAKYSPDTQEVEHEGQKMKVVRVEDVLAIL